MAAWTDGYPFRESLVVDPGSRSLPDTIASIASSPLSQAETTAILRQYSLETAAHDAYVRFFQLYALPAFDAAAREELAHADAVRLLAVRYGLSLPAGYGEYQGAYDNFRTQGEAGPKEALEAAARMEEFVIDQLSNSIRMTDNSDVATVFSEIGDASFAHLRTSLRAIVARDATTAVSAAGYLSLEDALSAPAFHGRLVSRLRLAAENAVSGTGSAPYGPSAQGLGPSSDRPYAGWENRYHSSVQRQLRDAVEKKYGPKLRSMGRYSLQETLARVDAAIEALEDRALSDAEKERLLNAYQTLRAYVVELLNR